MAEGNGEADELKLFHRWSFEGIEVNDPGLKRYLSLKPIHIPHSGGRHEHHRFSKSEVNVVERLINNMMRHGKCGGKKLKAMGIVRNALEIIQLKAGRNPLEILVRAVENSAPCEDVTRISYGGIVSHLSVDVSPQRRIDMALRFLTEGARRESFGNPKTIDECLADEITYASERDGRSHAVQKRDETERIARSSR